MMDPAHTRPISSQSLVRSWRALDDDLAPVRVIHATDEARISVTESSVVLDSLTLVATGEVRQGGTDSDTAIVDSDDSAEVAQTTPELLVGVSLVTEGYRTDEGAIIQAVAPVWRRFLDELARDPTAVYRLDPRQVEELVAGAYREDGWTVTLTPRSGDRGRDVIAERQDVGAIRVLDQVKHYAPGHIVSANDVRAVFGVLALDPRASKAVITTTSTFAPRVWDEFKPVMPTRLDLRDGAELRRWLNHIKR